NTHVITKCCHKALRIGHIATDHGSECGGTIPSNLPPSEGLRTKSIFQNHENAASVKIITLDVENRGKRDIGVNPFTNEELLAGTKTILLEEYHIDEIALEPVDPDFAKDFNHTVTKENYTRKFFDKTVITENGHLFDKEALESSLSNKNECPTCRRIVTILTDRRAERPRLYHSHLHVAHVANTLLQNETLKAPLLGTWALACAVGYVSLLTLSSATFGASLLLLGASSMIFSAIGSNEIKTGNRILAEKILIVTAAIFIPAACSYYGAALLGVSATTQIATTVASVALPSIYHVANMLT
ncbi:hypothetical protein COB11_05630, partial [Candidatus Aerophobetes bacterium]